jgi:hypothetical protein
LRKGRVECSHFHGRRKESVRFDERNVDLFCGGCHRKFHESPNSYVEFKKKQLGEREYKKLEIIANTYCKRDDKMRELELKELLKKLTTRPATSKG